MDEIIELGTVPGCPDHPEALLMLDTHPMRVSCSECGRVMPLVVKLKAEREPPLWDSAQDARSASL